MTFNEFIAYASHPVPDQRNGQAAFNALATVRPDLAEVVRGSLVDPFYRDELLPEFYEFLSEWWG